MTRRFTIFGGNGFVGAEVARRLEARGASVRRVVRGAWPEPGEELGDVVFTIGMTADFRKRLVETMELQVLRLHEALTRYRFGSFTYLSSARVYAQAASTREDAALLVRPLETDHVYNISKLAGESLCFAQRHPGVRVVRLSNVYGSRDRSNLFLTAVLREAVETGAVTIGQARSSSKDYIAVGDAAEAIIKVAERGSAPIYNIAAGRNVTHETIAGILTAAGYRAGFAEGGAEVSFPVIDVSRFTEEFGAPGSDPPAAIAAVLSEIASSRSAA